MYTITVLAFLIGIVVAAFPAAFFNARLKKRSQDIIDNLRLRINLDTERMAGLRNQVEQQTTSIKFYETRLREKERTFARAEVLPVLKDRIPERDIFIAPSNGFADTAVIDGGFQKTRQL